MITIRFKVSQGWEETCVTNSQNSYHIIEPCRFTLLRHKLEKF